MELRHLRYFVAVADELHFGRAAQRLGIAQPPLSQQIKRLEELIGVRLFERDRRGVRLTAAGEALLPQARDILVQAERAAELARRAGRGETGRLAVGFVGSATLSVLPEILLRFRGRYPDVELELREMSTQDQLVALRDGTIRAAFGRMSPVEPPLMRILVARDPMILALPSGLGRDMPNPVPLSIVAGAPFIMTPRHLGPGFYDLTISLCARAGFTPQVVQEAIQMQTIVGLVAAGVGVALVPASVERFQRDDVAYRRLEDRGSGSDLSLVWRQDNWPPIVGNLVAVTQDVAAQVNDSR